MVNFSQHLEEGIAKLEFGLRGGPFEANLRDIFKWCRFLYPHLSNEEIDLEDQVDQERFMKDFYLVLFEKMKLVYCQRMRNQQDKEYIFNAFSEFFLCDAFELEEKSKNVSIYWNDNGVYISNNFYRNHNMCSYSNQQNPPILLSSQMEMLNNIAECNIFQEPIIICGSNDCGKTKVLSSFICVKNLIKFFIIFR